MTQYYGDVYTAVSAFNLCVPSLRASNVTSLYPIHIFAVTVHEGRSEMDMSQKEANMAPPVFNRLNPQNHAQQRAGVI